MNTHSNGMDGRRSRKGSRLSSRDTGRRSKLGIAAQTKNTANSGSVGTPPADHSEPVTTRDFQALGLRLSECRLTVIRSAAARNARTLANRQLTSPSTATDTQLCRVAHSAYRLMDPRKRSDSYQRAYVGRILPITLLGAGRTRFAAGNEPTQEVLESHVQTFQRSLSELSKIGELEMATEVPPVHFEEPLISLANGMELDNHFSKTLNSNDILNRGPMHRSYLRLRATALRFRTPIAASIALACSILLYSISTNGVSTNRKTNDTLAQRSAVETSIALSQTSDVVGSPNLGSSTSDVAAITEVPAADLAATTISKSEEAADSDTARVKPSENFAITSDPELDAMGPLELVETGMADALPVDPSDDPTVDLTAQLIPKVPELAEVATMSPPSLDAETPTEGAEMLTEGIGEESPAEFLLDPFTDLVMSPSMASPSGDEVVEQTKPNNLADSVVLLPTPSPEAVEKVQQRLRGLSVSFQRSLTADDVDPVLTSLNDFAKSSSNKSTEYWTAKLLAAKIQWIVQDAEQVQKTLNPIVEHFDVSIDELMVESFVGTLAFREDLSTHAHRIHQGFRVMDYLLVNEEFSLATQVGDALENSIQFVDDESLTTRWRELTRSTEQMARLKTSVASVLESVQSVQGENDIVSTETVSDAQAGIAGRYLCLMRFRWNDGIAWMAAGSDARLAPLAKQELETPDEATAEDKIELAQRWMAASTRENGRAAESMLLHSRQLFQAAFEKANAVQEIELEKKIAEIELELPAHRRAPYRPAQTNPAQTTPGQSNPGESSSAPTSKQPNPQVPSSDVIDEPADDASRTTQSIPEINTDSPTETIEPSEGNSADFDRQRAISKIQRPKRSSVSSQPMISDQLPMLGSVKRRLRPSF